ncbi:hypothetical protein EJB05_27793, partial [Eragrostis curvula]
MALRTESTTAHNLIPVLVTVRLSWIGRVMPSSRERASTAPSRRAARARRWTGSARRRDGGASSHGAVERVSEGADAFFPSGWRASLLWRWAPPVGAGIFRNETLPPSSSSINYFSDFLSAAMGSLVAAAALLTGLLALAMPSDCNPEGDILFMQRAAWQQPITALDSWDPTLINPCTWVYVTCDNESHVTRLDLRNVGMSGPLIPELGDLEKLQFMELFGNGLNGSIPTTLGRLSNLINLDLQDNLLSGTIPTSLGAINTLKNIRLHGNNLTGSIPSSLGNLTNLVNLELQKNLLSGPIPASLGNIKTLRHLNGNMLTGMVPQEILSLVSDGSLSELIKLLGKYFWNLKSDRYSKEFKEISCLETSRNFTLLLVHEPYCVQYLMQSICNSIASERVNTRH